MRPHAAIRRTERKSTADMGEESGSLGVRESGNRKTGTGNRLQPPAPGLLDSLTPRLALQWTATAIIMHIPIDMAATTTATATFLFSTISFQKWYGVNLSTMVNAIRKIR